MSDAADIEAVGRPDSFRGKAAIRWVARGIAIALGIILVALFLLFVPRACGLVGCGNHKLHWTRNSVRGGIVPALRLYQKKNGAFPRTEQGLKALVDAQMLEFQLKDGWGNDFLYESDGTRYRITSLGADGAPGGEDDDAEIVFDSDGSK